MRAADFARKIKCAQSTLSAIENGKSKPGYEVLANILDAYPSINPYWLLKGEGGMFLEDLSVGNVLLINDTAKASDTITHDWEPSVVDRFHLPLLSNSKKYYAFTVEGDSMSGTIERDDIVICEELAPEDFRDEKVYLLVLTSGISIKRVRKVLNEPGNKKFELISDSRTIPPRVVDMEDVRKMFRIVYRMTRKNL